MCRLQSQLPNDFTSESLMLGTGSDGGSSGTVEVVLGSWDPSAEVGTRED